MQIIVSVHADICSMCLYYCYCPDVIAWIIHLVLLMLDPKVGCLENGFVIFLSSSRKVLEWRLKVVHDRFPSHISHVIFHTHHPPLRRHICAAEKS
jgi:hypothetical protein